MRYRTEKDNSDGTTKVIVEFGTTEEQQKLYTAFISFLESLIRMQKIFMINKLR